MKVESNAAKLYESLRARLNKALSKEKPKFKRPDILLHPQIPKPLHGLNPRNLLGQDWWDIQRKKAYAENNYCCWACGIHKNDAKYFQHLEAHECYLYDYDNCSAEMIEVTALCHSCHSYIHDGKMLMDLRKGLIPKSKFDDILAHGNNLKPEIPSTQNPYVKTYRRLLELGFSYEKETWSEWKLVLEGKEFCTQFKDREAWENHYS